ncbi:MAG: RNA polymerase sigma factor [Bacteroidota bacterium]
MKISWETIYKQQASRLLGLCRRYVGDTQIAEDLLHDAFATAMQKQHQFKGKGSVEGWLRTIMVNTTLMYLRQRNEWQEWKESTETSELAEQHAEDQKSTIQQANFQAKDLLAAIDQIPSHHRTVFNLYVFEGYKHREIARLLNISTGTSKSHLARARKNIQKILYQKALEMKKKKQSTLFAWSWLLLKPQKEAHYLDELFQEKLTHFELPLSPAKDTFLQTLTAHSKLQIVGAGISKTLLLSAGIGLCAGIGGIAYWNSTSKTATESIPISTEQPTTLLDSSTSQTIPAISILDSTDRTLKFPKATPNKPDLSSSVRVSEQPTNTKKDTPVVIRKQVIVRDTVFKITDQDEN